MILDLPAPPSGQRGWPWEAPAAPVSPTPADAALPRITIVTPSYNQGAFLERTIRSVLLQGYPNLEYIVIDGGSTDGSVEIIRKYDRWLAHWVSEKDRGQVDAINKGLRRATGDWVAWQNSDDVYCPGCLHAVARRCLRDPGAGFICANVNLIDASDRVLTDLRFVRPTRGAMLAEGMVLTNQAAFWRRSLHERIGYLDDSYACAFDFDWFLRVLRVARAAHVDRMMGGYRIHGETKSHALDELCRKERLAILGDERPSRWRVQLYRLRRIGLLLAHGHLYYLARALARRLRGAEMH